ncbi:cytochrome c oxidase assembly factor 1 homolog [Betta splendens]|uniref:Cytochrome c oxidase assembly factor 1 homolog n=1 Tax=Betta splendens TaxID=158456 RepID=A0A6P7L205_BETSP|nr:cytochrome c oxidase assembly factor 1 homolog [Betta splendens]XP_055359947.1 cytochrome c oxidase assembly factor 1 homolog [Betta splendens]
MTVSTRHLQQLAVFTTLLTGAGVGTMYYLMQKKFAQSDYHRLALQKLEECPVAMETLGAPPLRVSNIRLTDRHNHIDQYTAQMKIPVRGSKAGGYLYTSSVRDPITDRWSLRQAVLQFWEGQTVDLLQTPEPAPAQIQTEDFQELDPGHWP